MHFWSFSSKTNSTETRNRTENTKIKMRRGRTEEEEDNLPSASVPWKWKSLADRCVSVEIPDQSEFPSARGRAEFCLCTPTFKGSEILGFMKSINSTKRKVNFRKLLVRNFCKRGCPTPLALFFFFFLFVKSGLKRIQI